MLIEVHLYGKLRRFSENQNPRQESIIQVDIEEGDTIADVIERIGIPMNEVGRNIFLNGEYSELTRSVRHGDRLGIFPDDMQLLYKWYFKKREDRD